MSYLINALSNSFRNSNTPFLMGPSLRSYKSISLLILHVLERNQQISVWGKLRGICEGMVFLWIINMGPNTAERSNPQSIVSQRKTAVRCYRHWGDAETRKPRHCGDIGVYARVKSASYNSAAFAEQIRKTK